MTLRARWAVWTLNARRAGETELSPWVLILALVLAAPLAWIAVSALPRSVEDLEQAKSLGVVSRSIVQGYSKLTDTRGYLLGLAVGIGVPLGSWFLWATSWGRRTADGSSIVEPREADSASLPLRWPELLAASTLLTALFLKFDQARHAFVNPWVLLSEEGEMMAWVDTILRGQVLYKDAFSLYGPLTQYPVALLFKIFGPSLYVWRIWLFSLNVAALVVVYVLMRRLMHTRTGAAAGTLVIAMVCTSSTPAMSWSLSRVAMGLLALAGLQRSLETGRPRSFGIVGAVLAVSSFFSHEVAVSAGLAVACVLTLDHAWGRRLGWLAAGFVGAAVPLVAWIAAEGSLGAMLTNFAVFARVKLLGYGGLAFPAVHDLLRHGGEWPTPSDTLMAYFGPVALAFSAVLLGSRLLRGFRSARGATQVALLVFGIVLFRSAVARPDDTHVIFALPPVLVLVACWCEEAVLTLRQGRAVLTRRFAAGAFVTTAVLGLLPFHATIADNAEDAARQLALTLTGRFSRSSVPGYASLDTERSAGIDVPADLAGSIAETVRVIRSRTRPGEPIWAFPNESLLNFLADRPLSNAFPLAVFAATSEQREEMVAQLDRTRPRYGVLYPHAFVVDGVPWELAVPEPLAYLQTRYAQVETIGPFTIVQRLD